MMLELVVRVVSILFVGIVRGKFYGGVIIVIEEGMNIVLLIVLSLCVLVV